MPHYKREKGRVTGLLCHHAWEENRQGAAGHSPFSLAYLKILVAYCRQMFRSVQLLPQHPNDCGTDDYTAPQMNQRNHCFAHPTHQSINDGVI